ncbi:MAG: DUF1761 domain-containing protein [Flavobacteriales bacterium]|nr:DUF1761 domain-containing protein [Flavobacteriales bacterium]
MSITLSNLPWLGIALAFVLTSLLGAAWFTALFRKPYLRTLGRPVDEPQSKDPIYFVGPMVCNFLVILTTAILMDALGITTYGAALTFALVVGFGYLVTNTMNIAINPNMPRPIPYGILSGVYHLIAMMLVCLVLVAMR